MVQASTLDAAVAVFRKHGFVGASIRMLVEATGLSRSSLYNEFGDKDGLFTAALGHYIERDLTLDTVDRAIDEDLPCLLTRSCHELADLPTPASEMVLATLEQQWFGFIGDSDSSEMEARGTLALATRHGLATLAAAGVPAEVLRSAAKAL